MKWNVFQFNNKIYHAKIMQIELRNHVNRAENHIMVWNEVQFKVQYGILIILTITIISFRPSDLLTLLFLDIELIKVQEEWKQTKNELSNRIVISSSLYN